MNISRSKTINPVPPEKGSFPLDHYSECKVHMDNYLECVKTHDGATRFCQHIMKRYFQCRMDRDLMAKDEQLLDLLPDKPNLPDA